MSHHYGEDAVQAEIIGDRFRIVIRNHVTNAEIDITGPTEGVFEGPLGKHMSQPEARILGNEIAHLLRKVLMR